MVMFGDPFVGNIPKKLGSEELIQAIRVDIAGELEAILSYDAHARATDDQRVKTILYSIRDEERQHVGELLRLVEILDPQESQFLAQGRQEVEQLLNQQNQQNQPNQPNQQKPQTQQPQFGYYNPVSQQGNLPGMHHNRQMGQGSQWNAGNQQFNQGFPPQK